VALGVLAFVANVVWNVLMGRGAPAGDDPWQANSLEWATTSPPPHHNFTSLPPIRSERPVWDAREAAAGRQAGSRDG
jgi:cytochrome c oxidase subunit 1